MQKAKNELSTNEVLAIFKFNWSNKFDIAYIGVAQVA